MGRVTLDSHSWLLPALLGLTALASVFSAITGVRLGFRFGVPSNPATTRAFGVIGAVFCVIALAYWFVTVGPSA